MSGIKKSEHRNAARSRRMIKQAFGELLHEKDLHKITVTDIVERANISRGTFYAHYLGIDSMIKDPTNAVTSGMQFLEANKTYYGLFAQSAQGETFVGRIISYMENKFAPAVDSLFVGESNVRVKLFLLYTLGAYKNVILRWFSGDLDVSASECASMLIGFYLSSRPEEILSLP